MAKPKEPVWTVKRIAVLIVIGLATIAMVAVTILPGFMQSSASKQQAEDAQKQQDAQKQAIAKQLADNQPIAGQKATPFVKDEVKTLSVHVLKQGTGAVANANSTVKVSYFGWTSDGQIFDSSKKNGKNTPISFALNGVIPGWTKGLTGQKAGSLVKLVIPSDMAYGEAGSPPVIGANEPLAFIVQLEAVTNRK